MKCNYCDYDVSEDCKCCPNCGEDPKTKKKNKIKEQVNSEKNEEVVKTTIDTASLLPLWCLLGFFIPIVGLILFCVWIKDKPKEAKIAGVGALVRVVIFIFTFIFGLFLQYLKSKY